MIEKTIYDSGVVSVYARIWQLPLLPGLLPGDRLDSCQPRSLIFVLALSYCSLFHFSQRTSLSAWSTTVRIESPPCHRIKCGEKNFQYMKIREESDSEQSRISQHH